MPASEKHNAQPASSQAFLSELGRRLRLTREKAGLTVSDLARGSGLSRRHVTEAEAGRANPSILKLAQLADAMKVPLRELCDLSLRSHRGERVALVGLRGAGKTTVGRLLALELDAPFVELDERIEQLAGLSLGEIFNLHGTGAFHRYEADALEKVLAEGERVVIAAGGSIVEDRTNFERLRETCQTVWLRARNEIHFQRVLDQGDRRPMADRPRAMEDLARLIESRAPRYAQCRFEVQTSDSSANEVIAEVARLVGE